MNHYSDQFTDKAVVEGKGILKAVKRRKRQCTADVRSKEDLNVGVSIEQF